MGELITGKLLSPRPLCNKCKEQPMVYMTLGLCRNCRSELVRPEYYRRNKEHILAKSKQYREEHPGYSDDSKRKYRETHKAECNQRIAEWQKNNPLKHNHYENKRRAQKKNTEVIEFNITDIIKPDNNICGICHKRIKKGDLHIDHIVPLSQGGGHVPWNIQPAHKSCNLIKGKGWLPSQTKLPLKEMII